MNTVKFGLLLMVMCIVVACASSQIFMKDQSKLAHVNKVAIFPFKSNIPVLGETLSDEVTNNFITSRMSVIERTELSKLLTERKLTEEGVIDNPQLLVGRLSGIDAIVVGRANFSRGWAGVLFGGNVDYVSNCSARMIDVKTGEVLGAATFASSAPNTLDFQFATPESVGKKIVGQFFGEK